MARLTELDQCVLGVIWYLGPVSAYGVRNHFRRSSTAAWSSSTGSIYPAIRRLEAAGLIKASAPHDARRTQKLTITEAGLAELRTWVTQLPADLGTATPDPLRTRAQFVTSVPPPQRLEFVATAREVTLHALRELETYANTADGNEDFLDRVGTMGAILELKARLAWLDLVEEELTADVDA